MSVETGTDSDYGPMDTRYAVYLAPPPGSPLKQLADAWLGRDPDRDERVSQPIVEAIPPERLHEITAFPRHYGFHATLTAPFIPAPGVEADALLGDVEAFAAAQRPFRVRLKVDELDGFLALVPAAGPSPELDRLAAGCVREFDRFRAPMTAEERARRQPERLSEKEREYLERWGYPYVFEFFRFHMTLTGPLEEPERGKVRAILERAFAPLLAEPIRVDQLTLFTQTHRVAPFRVVARFPFRA
jgi:putative phosphonate metabolism protein